MAAPGRPGVPVPRGGGAGASGRRPSLRDNTQAPWRSSL
jgi:hypothetical protein